MSEIKQKKVQTKQKNLKVLHFIDWCAFDPTKLNFKLMPYKETHLISYPFYQYSKTNSNKFYFCTHFIKLMNDPLKNYKPEITKLVIMQFDFYNMISFFKQYETAVKDFISQTPYKDYTNAKPILNMQSKYRADYSDNNLVNIYVKIKNGYMRTDITNHNIAKKKFPAVETFTNPNIETTKRILHKDKEVRLLLRPKLWISHTTKSYGTAFKIDIMEVKYADMTVNSIFDKKNVQQHVSSVVI